MELKDLILSTLAELEKNGDEPEIEPKREIERTRKEEEAYPTFQREIEKEPIKEVEKEIAIQPQTIKPQHPRAIEIEPQKNSDEEVKFLTSVRERILVLFEGLQSPNNAKLEAKVDIIINFLEYQLSVIDERLEAKKREI